MKITTSFLSILFLFTLTSSSLFAQNREITIILLRHAEKDVSSSADKINPDLTPEGKQRAERLVETIKKYKPNQIFSTNYKRTRATVLPLAEKTNPRYRIQIQIYDFDKLEEFASQLLKSKARTIVVVGHNTTTPELANLLIKQDKYKPLAETEYDKIWVIKIKRNKRKPNKIKEKIIEY